MSSKFLEEKEFRNFFNILGDLEQREEILAQLAEKIEEGSKVVDIATGSGYFARNFLEREVFLVCVDIDTRALMSLKKELSSISKKAHFEFIISDAAWLPFKEHVFEYSIGWSALVHIKDWRISVEEMFRVSRNIILAEPSGEYAVRAFRDFMYNYSPPSPREWLGEFYRRGSVNIKIKDFVMVVEVKSENRSCAPNVNSSLWVPSSKGREA
jgi:ubiquinone/menaquinone biosynthesis C-methylase UbiE